MRVASLLSACFLGAFAHANDDNSVSIDAVVPSEEFSYGCHELRWTADMDGDGLIGPDEVELRRAGTWSALTADEYQNIVVRRRSQLYMENAFIYKKTPTRDLELYVDYPKGWQPTDKRPAIVWFFGGAWTTGTPFAFKPQADYFARRGLVCIMVDYRIRTVDGIKSDGYTSGLDAKTAIRWVRKNASSLGIDPDKIMAGGDSAGGHLAIATQIPDLNDPVDDTSISTKVAALLVHNPYVVYINPQSWVYQIDFKTLPPVWIAYGLKDKAAYTDDPSSKRTERNGESFVRELGEAGIALRTYIKADGGHGFCSGPEHLEPSTLDKDDFLQECGILEPGTVPGPGKKTAGVWKKEHDEKIVSGQVKRSQPRVLEFPSKKNP
ncbi:MAG: alpha/beta hydrolase [Akkermansiaceae bacterium]